MTFQPPAGPGKTAPKLSQDFLAFDPVRGGKPNVLTDHTPPSGEGPQVAAPIGSCRHEYTTKFTQSILPPLDLRSDGNHTFKIAATCKKCRIHADIHLDHSNSSNACPTSAHPLHHFQRVHSHDSISAERIKYAWRCSVDECHATLFIAFRRPRLHDDEIQLLTYPDSLRKRYDDLVKEDPKREGLKLASQMDALSRLRRYIRDCLNVQHNKRHFPSNNKRFQEVFGLNGQDCTALLQRLGFKYAEHTWTLPDPEQIPDRLQSDGNSEREELEDVELELRACMFKLTLEQPDLINPAAGEGWSSANRDIERTLGAQGYTRYVSTRRSAASLTELPFFNSLGTLPDFSDNLVEYAYDRQILCDPEGQTYYFECLQEISESRNTEQLQVKVATLQSQDIVSRRDISAAYQFLNITNSEAKTIDDARMIERFQAQQSDLGIAAQEIARSHLYKLGIARQSTLLINASRQSVDTYEDALSWLGNGATKQTPDEGILAVLAIRTADNTTNEEIGQKAISAIAKARQSNMLNNWLLTGRQDGYTMSVDEALRHLNIEQKLDALDPTIVPILFESARQDRPGENTEKAINTIQQALTHANGGTAVHAPETWPVGLTSHGNTCYLNSLLQYYFSIRPLRDIILDYDKYKLDTAAHTEKEERVGQRQVSGVEIKGGQRFADDLKHLFGKMITSSDTAVKPEEDLVCRAFLDPKEYRLLDSSWKDVSVISTDKQMVNGVPESNEDPFTDAQMIASPIETPNTERHQSETSSATLQASGDDADVAMKSVEMPPTPPASPGLKGEQQQQSQTDTVVPPPLPPRRRFSTAKEEALDIAKTKARQQQDVTEVHDGALFRLRCGMMPQGRDNSGEQEDAMRDLFNILIEETIVNEGVEQKPKTLADSNIQLNVPYESTDIYSALDAVFDLQAYGENAAMETFKSISALPPLVQINIPRIGYSATGAFKANECVRLDDELYLDRYFDHRHPEILAKRKKCWEWRKRLQVLKIEQRIMSKTATDLDGPNVVAQTAQYLTSLDEVNRDLQCIGVGMIEADGEITDALSTDAEKQASSLSSLDREIDTLQKSIDAEFAEMKNVKYRLAAVFFHRGQHGHGHYWIYIHDFQNNVWRSYNDERVEEFTKLDEIFEAKTYSHGTPTYAVYVDANKLDTIQAVCRDPEKAPTPPIVPEVQVEREVEMTNTSNGHEKPPYQFVNPKLTIEGGQQPWDENRQVADVSCLRIRRDSTTRVVHFADEDALILQDEDIGYARYLQQQELECYSRSLNRTPSPGKRHGPADAASGGGTFPKLRRVGKARKLPPMRELLTDGGETAVPELVLDSAVSSAESSPLSEMEDLELDAKGGR